MTDQRYAIGWRTPSNNGHARVIVGDTYRGAVVEEVQVTGRVTPAWLWSLDVMREVRSVRREILREVKLAKASRALAAGIRVIDATSRENGPLRETLPGPEASASPEGATDDA